MFNSDKKIVVVIPVYNVEKYLTRCVNSVLKQSYSNFDIVLVDDGSTDDSGRICDDLSKVYSNITVIHKKNGGLSSARNAGIELAIKHDTYEWITFIDSDDWIHPECFFSMIKAVEADSTDLCICNYKNVSEENDSDLNGIKADFHSHVKQIEGEFVKDPTRLTTAWCKLFRISLFVNHRFPEGKYHEDCFLIHKVIFPLTKASFIDYPFYFYFENPTGITHTVSLSRISDLYLALKNRLLYFKENGYRKAYLSSLYSSEYNSTVISLFKSGSREVSKRERTLAALRLKVSIFTENISFEKQEWVYALAYPVLYRIIVSGGRYLKRRV